MSARSIASLFVLLAVCMALGHAAAAQDEASRTKTRIEKLRKLLEDSVDWHQFHLSDDKQLLKQLPKPPLKPHIVLRWDNQVRGQGGSAVGLTVIWTDDTRPQAIASIYPWSGGLNHEFDLLSREATLVGKREGRVVWQPKKIGIEFRAVPEAPPPAETKDRRRLQLRQLAAGFEATMLGWNPDNSDRQELRMMPQWLHRYGREGAACLDGAIYSFAMGTDPEAVLLLEAFKPSKSNEDAYQWQFAFIRQTSGALEGRWKENVVWTAEKFPNGDEPALPHFTLREPLPVELTSATE
jgi:hypothetical protein